jgi:putative FmdB family regulatory protein
MPLYEYECSTCGHVFEVIRKFSDPPEEKCPKCGGPVHKRQSAPAFQFKGTGWYVTDYAKSGSTEGKAGAEGKTEEKKGASTESSGKSDSSTGGSSASTSSTSASPAASSGTTTKSDG